MMTFIYQNILVGIQYLMKHFTMKCFMGKFSNTVLYGPVRISTKVADFTDSEQIIAYKLHEVLVNSIPLYA